MPIAKYDPAEIQAVAGKNRLRNYPNPRKGRDRLLPYAKPQITTELQFPPDATFFVVGNCFGRNLERGLTLANRTFLSSTRDLDLPGTAQEQYNRYNMVNLDVATNEIAWAIDPNAPSPDDALIKVGDEWVDMQIHWSFAHDLETARKYRATYNSAYAPIVDADVVILILGGFEQWFDRDTGLYLNGMPTRKMTDLYPGRFEFHQMNDGTERSVRRCVETILANSNKTPQILVTLTPGQQPLVFGQNDAILELSLAKSYQRIAIERVCQDYSQVEYLPGQEFGFMSDNKFTFMETSINHPKQNLANRLIAEMLLKYDGETPGYHAVNAVGHAEALLLAEQYADAIAVCDAAIEAGAPLSWEFDFQYVDALRRNNEGQRAIDWLLSRLQITVGEHRENIIKRLSGLVRSHGTPEQIEQAIDALEGQVDDDVIAQLNKAKEARLASPKAALVHSAKRAKAAELFKNQDFEGVVVYGLELLDDEEAGDTDKHSILPYVINSFMRQNLKRDAVDYLLSMAEGLDGQLDERWSALLLNMSRPYRNDEIGARLDAAKDKLHTPLPASAEAAGSAQEDQPQYSQG